MTDSVSALAGALRSTAERWGKGAGNDAIDYLPNAETWAARALAAMPDWTLVPKGPISVMVDMVTADNERMEAEIERLRETEVASQQCSGSPKHYGGCGCLCHAALAPAPSEPG